MYTFNFNQPIGQLFDISIKNFIKNFIFLKIFISECSYIEVWFMDQNAKPLEIEDKINITIVINLSAKYKKWRAIQFNLELTSLKSSKLFKSKAIITGKTSVAGGGNAKDVKIAVPLK